MPRREDGDTRVSARRAAETHQSGFESKSIRLPDGVEWFKVDKQEIRTIDVLPYRVGKGNPRASEGMIYFERTYFTHRNIGPGEDSVICPNRTWEKRCPICEDMARMRRDPEMDPEVPKALKPKERQLFNVIDLNAPDKGIQIWDVSFYLFGEALYEAIKNSDDEEDGYAFFSDLKVGLKLKIGFKEKHFAGNTFYEAARIDFKPRAKPYSKEILEQTYCLDDLLIEIPYDKLRALYLQEDGKGSNDEEGSEEEGYETVYEPAKKPAARRPAPAAAEEEDDFADPPPRRAARNGSARPKPQPEEAEEEAWEDEEPAPAPAKPAAKRRPAPPPEDEPEEEEAPPARPARRPTAAATAPAKRRPAPPPEEEYEEEEEQTPPPKRRPAAPPVEEAEEDDWDDWDEEEAAAPPPKRRPK